MDIAVLCVIGLVIFFGGVIAGALVLVMLLCWAADDLPPRLDNIIESHTPRD